ncbi:MAG: metal ABC transporter permease [Pseudomonadota bacterium]|nr:metal ABC transporter permease [Pseudomonadota bacterium]HJO34886.1 metal ABC transporter permease [Gammaproteobacteria bacterium]
MSALLTAFLTQRFLTHALLGGMLASLAAGLLGPFVVARRISYLAGGIAHSVLGGIGLAHWLGWPPLLGAAGAAVLSGLAIGTIHRRWRAQEDTLISALWAGGMAAGVLLLTATPGYQNDLSSYLFGNILMLDGPALMLMAGLDGLLLVVMALLHRHLRAVSFDADFAQLRGLPVMALELLLMTLIALTVVVMLQVVGLILLIALLTLPAAGAERLLRTLPAISLATTGIAAACSASGLALAYLADWPAGPAIVLTTLAAYVLCLLAPRRLMGASS